MSHEERMEQLGRRAKHQEPLGLALPRFIQASESVKPLSCVKHRVERHGLGEGRLPIPADISVKSGEELDAARQRLSTQRDAAWHSRSPAPCSPAGSAAKTDRPPLRAQQNKQLDAIKARVSAAKAFSEALTCRNAEQRRAQPKTAKASTPTSRADSSSSMRGAPVAASAAVGHIAVRQPLVERHLPSGTAHTAASSTQGGSAAAPAMPSAAQAEAAAAVASPSSVCAGQPAAEAATSTGAPASGQCSISVVPAGGCSAACSDSQVGPEQSNNQVTLPSATHSMQGSSNSSSAEAFAVASATQPLVGAGAGRTAAGAGAGAGAAEVVPEITPVDPDGVLDAASSAAGVDEAHQPTVTAAAPLADVSTGNTPAGPQAAGPLWFTSADAGCRLLAFTPAGSSAVSTAARGCEKLALRKGHHQQQQQVFQATSTLTAGSDWAQPCGVGAGGVGPHWSPVAAGGQVAPLRVVRPMGTPERPPSQQQVGNLQQPKVQQGQQARPPWQGTNDRARRSSTDGSGSSSNRAASQDVANAPAGSAVQNSMAALDGNTRGNASVSTHRVSLTAGAAVPSLHAQGSHKSVGARAVGTSNAVFSNPELARLAGAAAEKVAKRRLVLPQLCACGHGISVLDPTYSQHCCTNCPLRLDATAHEQLLLGLLASMC